MRKKKSDIIEVLVQMDCEPSDIERMLTELDVAFERSSDGFILHGSRLPLYDACLKLYSQLDYESFIAEEIGGKVMLCG